MKRRRFLSRAGQEGFTLTEITVALVAGLFVAISVMALSREATATFHEEVKSSAAESAARTAVDRLRADLQRSAFMSTANVVADPAIYHAATDTNVSKMTAGLLGLRRLAGIRLISGGSTGTTPLSTNTANGLNPDAIEIGGNFTTIDQFPTARVEAPTGGCQKVLLVRDSAPIQRIRAAGASAGSVLRSAFQPVSATATTQFIVRIVDATGKMQYAATCPVAAAAGFDSSGIPFVMLENNTDGFGIAPIQQNGIGSGLSLNPVQIIRWQITNAPPAQYTAGLNSSSDATKYDLIRSFVDASGTVVDETTEVVAEYAVDLKFAFSVEGGDVDALNPVVSHLAFDADSANAAWAYNVSGTAASTTGPQRIRSVRVRLVTRASQADRSLPIAPTPANFLSQKYLYRYCVDTDSAVCAAPGDKKVWARARTIATEVALVNQARFFY